MVALRWRKVPSSVGGIMNGNDVGISGSDRSSPPISIYGSRVVRASLY